MSREELKELLHQKIDATDNDELLERVKFWLELESELEEPNLLTKAEAQAVQEGLADYHKGKTITNEDFKKEVRGWRGK